MSEWVERCFAGFDFGLDEAGAADVLDAQEHVDAYLTDLVARKRRSPGDDLTSDLIRAEEEGDRLSGEEVLVLLDNVLAAGTDTTRNQLAAATYLLATHPDQADLLAGSPEAVPNAVEEVLRFRPTVAGTLRRATVDIDVEGVRFPEGTVVSPVMAAANRDPAVFADPTRFDVTRQLEQPVLSFGGGAHFCLGAALARVELQEGLGAVARRLPGLQLDGSVPWKSIVGVSGPVSLPVTFATP